MTDFPSTLHDPALRELLCAHEALRRYGFLPEELFVEWCPHGAVYVVVRPADALGEFRLGPRQVQDTQDAFHDAWHAAVETWNALPQHVADEIYTRSFVAHNAAALTTALLTRGFPPRARTLN